MLTDTQWERIADLWISDEYSPIDIGKELSISLDDIEAVIRQIEYVHKVIRLALLRRVKEALDLED